MFICSIGDLQWCTRARTRCQKYLYKQTFQYLCPGFKANVTSPNKKKEPSSCSTLLICFCYVLRTASRCVAMTPPPSASRRSGGGGATAYMPRKLACWQWNGKEAGEREAEKREEAEERKVEASLLANRANRASGASRCSPASPVSPTSSASPDSR